MISTTYHGMLTNLSWRAGLVARDLAELQEQATTGLSVTRPSDATSRLSWIHSCTSQLADQETWYANAQTATSILDTAESALDGISDLLSRVRELATQFSSDHYNPEDAANAADEVRSILEQVVQLANTQFGGRYVFGGTAYDQPPFEADGTYSGNTGTPSTMVGDGIEVQTGFDGSDIFQSDVDTFAVISALATALDADDATAVQACLDSIDTASTQLTAARSRIGAEVNRASDAMELAGNLEVLLAQSLDEATGVDEVEVYTRLAETQATYEAVLQVMGGTRTASLFSYL